MSKTASAPPQRAGRREWLGLAIIALPCLLYSMDFTVLHLAVPHLSAALHPTSVQLLWIVDIYGFLLAGSLISMGVLGDRIGRRKLLLVGAAIFGLTSILAAFAHSAVTLIIARAVLGLAAATLAPSTLSLIRNMFFDPKQRSMAIGVWIASFSAGAAIGPLAGGVLLSHFWWGSVFLIAVPAMVLLLALGPRLLPEYRDPAAGKLDITSAVLSLVAVLTVIYGIKDAAEHGFGMLPIAAILFGLGIGGLFIRRQHRLTQPFMDLRLFRSKLFSGILLVNIMDFFLGFGSFFFFTQYMQLVLGLDAQAAGLWTLPWAVVQVAGSLLTPLLVRRVRPGHIMAGGFVVAAIGFAMLTRLTGHDDLVFFLIGSSIFSLGLIPITTLATDIIVGSVPPQRAGTASGVSEMSSELGGALGIALLGSVATAVYRGKLAEGVPQGLSTQVTETAQNTLGGALSVTAQLPDVVGARLAAAARGAFVDATVLVFTLCAIASLATAVLALSVTRHLKSHNENEADDKVS
jgi:DHA2 family multidrug resistance protein-like MFS transporter